MKTVQEYAASVLQNEAQTKQYTEKAIIQLVNSGARYDKNCDTNQYTDAVSKTMQEYDNVFNYVDYTIAYDVEDTDECDPDGYMVSIDGIEYFYPVYYNGVEQQVAIYIAADYAEYVHEQTITLLTKQVDEQLNNINPATAEQIRGLDENDLLHGLDWYLSERGEFPELKAIKSIKLWTPADVEPGEWTFMAEVEIDPAVPTYGLYDWVNQTSNYGGAMYTNNVYEFYVTDYFMEVYRTYCTTVQQLKAA